MDLTIEEKQNDQSEQKQSGGGISQGINTLNNLRGLKNLSGKTGLRTATQAGRLAAQGAARLGTFLFTNPAGWVILAIVAVAVLTLIIVLALGAPPMQTENVQTVAPATMPTPAL